MNTVMLVLGILVIIMAGVALMSMLRGKPKKQADVEYVPHLRALAAGESASSASPGAYSPDNTKPKTDEEKPETPKPKIAVTPPPFRPKHPVRNFIGRRAPISDVLTKHLREEVILLGLHGESGMGRTTLAIELAKKLRPRYPNASFYIDLKSHSKHPVSTAEAMAQIIWFFRPSVKLPTDPDALAALYSTVLREQRAIILLDNIDKAKARALIPPKNCLLLAVSREPLPLPGMYNRKIDVFPLEESRELISDIAPRAGTWANDIVKFCDNLPLAITIVGKFLSKYSDVKQAGLIEHLRGLREEKKAAADQKQPDKEETDHVGLSSVLGMVSKFLSGKTAMVWHKLLVFPGAFGRKAVEFVCDDDEDNVHLCHLVSIGFVEYDPMSDRYCLHELARDYMEKHMNKVEHAEASALHASYYLTVISAANDLYQRDDEGIKRALDLISLEWENIQAGFVWAEKQAGKDGAAAKLCSAYVETGYDLFKMRHRSSGVRLKWLESALNASRITQDKEAEMSHLLNLGLEYGGQGEHAQSIDSFQQALALAKSLNNRVDECAVLRHLGIAYSATGDTVLALEYHQQALDLARSRGDKVDEGKALSSLGWIHKRSRNFPQAAEFFQLRLAIAEEEKDERAEALALKAIADIRMETESEMAPVIDLYSRSFKVFQKLKDLHAQGLVLKRMGHIYLRKSNYPSALKFFEKATAVFQNTRHLRNEGRSVLGLGMVHAAENKLPLAIEFYQKALNLFQTTMEKKDQFSALKQLAVAYKDSMEMDNSIKAYEQGLALARELGDRPKEGQMCWGLSQALDISGDRPKAVQHAETALSILETSQDPLVADIQKKLEEWKMQDATGG